MRFHNGVVRLLMLALLLCIPPMEGCGGGDGGGTTAPELGAEVDLSLYAPSSWIDYYATYRSMTFVDTVETSTWHMANEVVFDTDPVTGAQVEVPCTVLQEEPDYIFSTLGEMRSYSDDQYLYGIKIYGGGTWEPLYYFRPKMKIAPDENPRINGVFDSDGSSLVFPYEDQGYRAVIWLRSWTTYLAIEDSVTVPAGTFYNCLKTRDRQRIHIKATALNDTAAVIAGSVYSAESESYSWMAPGVGTVRTTAGSGQDAAERVLVSATVDDVDYPVVKGETDWLARHSGRENRFAERPPDLGDRFIDPTDWSSLGILPGLLIAR